MTDGCIIEKVIDSIGTRVIIHIEDEEICFIEVFPGKNKILRHYAGYAFEVIDDIEDEE